MILGINKIYLCVGLLTTMLLTTAVNANTQVKKSDALDNTMMRDYAHKSIELSLSEQKIKINLPLNNSYLNHKKQLLNENKPRKLTKVSLISQ